MQGSAVRQAGESRSPDAMRSKQQALSCGRGGMDVTGFALLLGFYLLGYALQSGLQLPIPANVLGMLLFTAALFLKWVKLEWVEEASAFLIRHMLLFFAPFVVGTMVFFPYIGEHALQIIASLLLSTFGVLLTTGWSAKAVDAAFGKRRPGKNTGAKEDISG